MGWKKEQFIEIENKRNNFLVFLSFIFLSLLLLDIS